ncbi:MAG: hypothetical protein COA79_25050 [Planctomycetota bacterium]|nr:MAG: hypothetical protein COA79_25050 [Planctomycetota bacterium]
MKKYYNVYIPIFLFVFLVAGCNSSSQKVVSQETKDRSIALYKEGLVIQKKGRTKAGLAKYDQAIRIDPDNWACLNHYAWYLAVEAPKEDQDLKRALRMVVVSNKVQNQKNRDVLDTLAEIYHRMGRHKEAVAAQKMALMSGTVGNSKKGYLEQQLKKFEEKLKPDQ